MELAQLVRQAFDALNHRDLDAFCALLDERVEWLDQAAIPGSDAHRGVPAVRRHMRAWLAAWDPISYEIEEIIEDTPEVIVMALRRARGRRSGAEVADHAAYHVTISGSRILRFAGYTNRASAMDGAGLKA